MLDELEQSWSRSLSWEEYSSICDRMTGIRTQLRHERGVKGPMMFCRHCKEVHEMSPVPVTIRSVLFALRKRGLLTDAELQKMDVEWRRYRSKHRLDGYGRKRAEPASRGNAAPPGPRRHPGMQGNTTLSVGVAHKNPFDELVVEQARAVYEFVEHPSLARFRHPRW